MKEKYAMISGTFIGGDTNAHCIYRWWYKCTLHL